MTTDEKKLYNEMKKLAKTANQRILRAERLTGQKGLFATKQLEDYLSNDKINVWTESGRIGVRKNLSKLQMQGVIRATKNFLKDNTSKVSGIKSYTKKVSKDAGFNLSYGQASTYYIVVRDYKWIYEYMGSSFWDFARDCVKQNWSEQTFIDNLSTFITDKSLDDKLKYDLHLLYEYAKGVRI